MELEIIFAGLILILLVFLATVDLAFSLLSDLSLRRLSSDSEDEQKAGTLFLRNILDNRPRFRFTLSSIIQILLICFTVLVMLILLQFQMDRIWLLIFALLVGLGATIVFRQVIPWLLVRNEPEKKLLYLLPVLRPLYYPISILANPISYLFSSSKENPKLDATVLPETTDEKTEDNADDFHALMEVGEAEGIFEENERELIESLVEFSDTRAGEIMTPRTEICALSIDSTIMAARDLIIAEKYSRLPVYRESIDSIEGVIYVRDLLQAWSEGKENQPIANILRAPYFVPETKSVADLLKSLQVEHIQLAIVIDEYGGVAGIVTVEDILEEIVGEIEDEDSESDEIIEIIEGEDGYCDVLGSTEIDKIERLFDLDLEDEDYTTIAGMVTSEAGFIPKQGEVLEMHGLHIEILEADDKRVTRLRLRKLVADLSDIATDHSTFE